MSDTRMFTLVYAPGSEPDARPQRRGYGELPVALYEAWLAALRGEQVLGIEEDGEEILDGDELLGIFARMEGLLLSELNGNPRGDCRELARRIVERMEV